MEDEVTDTKKHLGETSNDEKERSGREIKDEQLALQSSANNTSETTLFSKKLLRGREAW